IDYNKQAIEIDREIGDKRGEGIDCGNLGEAYLERCVRQNAETWLPQAVELHQRALEIFKDIGSVGVSEEYKRLGTAYLFTSNVEQATAHFQRCVKTCDQVLEQSQLYRVLYYRAFALLALFVVSHATECSGVQHDGASLRCGSDDEQSLEAYRKALSVNSAAGVLREQIHEVERLKQILIQKDLHTPEALAPMDTVLSLLRDHTYGSAALRGGLEI
ncbi:MAG: tetratricopeptide repeat protein, partial [Gammaproteobacteria bacterium]|nr:tetratricopeptide repeat protein [Gammaproteobacteria bacterium]